MTLNVLIIQKVTGNYTATYTGNQRTTTQPEPRKQANTRTPRKIRTSVPHKGIPATPQAVRATLAEIAAENPRVILATLPKPVKGVTIKKNTYINIAGIEISARVIIDTLKNLKNEFITLTINAINKTIEIIYTCDGLKGKTTIKHITDTIPGAQIIPVTSQEASNESIKH